MLITYLSSWNISAVTEQIRRDGPSVIKFCQRGQGFLICLQIVKMANSHASHHFGLLFIRLCNVSDITVSGEE